jgi:AcrR family transcriptional regulator
MTRAESTAATREGIIRAARTLLFADRSYDDVTLTEIAAAAGVSHQTVLNHFESKEGVALAVFDELGAEIRAARYRLRPGNVKRMVKALVEEYDRVGEPTVRWLAAALRRERLAVVMESGRVEHQRWLAFMFDDRLPKNPAARRRALNALHAATDVYVWHLLRRDLRASRAETEKTMTDLVFGVLEDVSR